MFKLCLILIILKICEIESVLKIDITTPSSPLPVQYKDNLMKVKIPIGIQRRYKYKLEDLEKHYDKLVEEFQSNGMSHSKKRSDPRFDTNIGFSGRPGFKQHQSTRIEVEPQNLPNENQYIDDIETYRRQGNYFDAIADAALTNYLKRLRKKSRRHERHDEEDLRYDLEDEALLNTFY